MMSESAQKQETMKESQKKLQGHDQEQVVVISQKKLKRRRVCKMVTGALLLLLIVLLIVAIILALTLFKSKEPKTTIVSATLEGISPRVTLPAVDIELNMTFDLQILVENKNRASFKHEMGNSVLLFKGEQVGETDIKPGLIPSRGSETLSCRLTLEADNLASSSNMGGLVGDLMGGELSVDTVTRIPGRVTFLGFIKKHIIAKSNCQFNVSIPALKITSQVCKTKATL
ncbi:hypothetical protein Fmac_018047 [Flemingia macrophylla]|uniref:Late embryogenesis abundant protein LEA-2 subgroup domain-containing protein n=1 Tax=Flemingia macrophylla TaxID=520843 RepID=A0ABD1M415_9FABA